MALFTDGAISSLEDLRGYESTIYDLASTERIDLSRKLVLAHQELEVELVSRFFRENPNELAYAVVTPALQLWHTFHTLAVVYRDAYNSHLNDRYQVPGVSRSKLYLLYRGVYDSVYDTMPASIEDKDLQGDPVSRFARSLESLDDKKRDELKFNNQIREAYMDLYFKNIPFTLRVGKQQIVWGESDGFQPS